MPIKYIEIRKINNIAFYGNGIFKLNPELKNHDSKWALSCIVCQYERIVTYKNAFYSLSGKTENRCRKCVERSDAGRFKKGRNSSESQKKATLSRIGIKNLKMSKRLEYEHIFYPEKMLSLEIKEKQRKAKLGCYGPLANGWQGGKTNERRLALNRDDYKQLRRLVFERDSYSCQICKIIGGQLEMDHIKEWSNYPELRYDINNCRTLCKKCHKETDNYLYKAVKKRKLNAF